jgi:prepilin-type N-terminal cleavage/methylation domain-containing protein
LPTLFWSADSIPVKNNMKKQKGMSLLEVLVSLALLGIISVLFLSSAANSAHSRFQADERTSAKTLAESVIEAVKKADYSSNYTAAVDEATAPDEYQGYSVDLTAAFMESPDLQKITVDIYHGARKVLTLENLKANR